MNKEAALTENYFVFFYILAIAIIIFTVISLILIFIRKKILRINKSQINGKTLFNIILSFNCCFIIILSLFFSVFLKDYKSVKEQNFEIIIGTVVAYSQSYETNDGGSAYDYNSSPIFLLENGEKIKLIVGPTELYGKYKIIYLKHCKLAEIIEIL